MNSAQRGDTIVVARDSRPMRIFVLGSGALFALWWSFDQPVFGVPVFIAWAALLIHAYRSPVQTRFADTEGIAGLRVRVPRDRARSWLRRRELIHCVTPWEEIESVRVVSSPLSLAHIQVHLTDGRDARLDASAVTVRGLRKVANAVERLRPDTT
jgi:hypothetical protein